MLQIKLIVVIFRYNKMLLIKIILFFCVILIYSIFKWIRDFKFGMVGKKDIYGFILLLIRRVVKWESCVIVWIFN